MMGSFPTRISVMVVGYVYPAYKCYKTVEKQDLTVDKLKFWCQYWILVALLTVCDNIVSWLPLYGEAKLVFILYLWHPKTMGTGYIYGTFLRPYLTKHEKEIDLNLQKMGLKVGMLTTQIWEKALSYGQCRLSEVLQYVNQESSKKKKEGNYN